VFIQSSKNISMPGIALLVSSLNGSVPSGLSLYINNSYAGSPNQYGFIVAYGIGNVTIKYGNNTLPLAHLSPINSISSINVKSLINSVASSLITFFVPIAGIIAGYDSIAKDKVSGALELIISRPVKRETIYWAKTLGTFISILILFLISIIIFYITALNYGLVLSILNLIAIFVSVAFLSFIFILIESFSGFFSKSLSTPIIWGIVIWIFFNMIYSIITLGVALATSTNILSLEFIKLSNIVGLGNPIDVAKFITYFSLPNAETLVYGINLNIVVVASILWVIIPTMIYLYLMRKYD
ncbi:MAG: ABC transporter permease subunit, partial [Thermoplasmata archaeon]